jgi:hypothetical protein
MTEQMITVPYTQLNIVYTSEKHLDEKLNGSDAHQFVARQKRYRMDTDKLDFTKV